MNARLQPRTARRPETAQIIGLSHDGRGVARAGNGAGAGGEVSGHAPGPASGPAPGHASGPVSGPASGQVSEQVSGHASGKTIFIDDALPGELVEWLRVKRGRNFDEGRLQQVLSASPDRVTPRCAHFGVCGGCALQHLAPARQIEFKQQQLAEALRRIGRVEPAHMLPPLQGGVWNYRRRARLAARWVPKKNRTVVGFRERSAPYVADLQRCEVLQAPVDALLQPLSLLFSELSIRNRIPQVEVAVADNAAALVIRVLDAPTDADRERLRRFGEEHKVRIYLQPGGYDTVALLEQEPRDPAGTSTGPDAGPGAFAADAGVGEADAGRSAAGADVRGADTGGSEAGPDARTCTAAASHEAEPLEYRLPSFQLALQFLPTDFVQVNAELNLRMIERAVELLAPAPGERVLDLFCGIGNFSLPLARSGAHVVGVEGDAGLVERARANARRNGLSNTEFFAANLAAEDLAEIGARNDASGGPGAAAGPRTWPLRRYDKVLLDPPRAGAREVLPLIARSGATKVLYVSCHPGSLARDAGLLVHEHGYTLQAAGVMDMFPHTAHVESAALFERG